MSKTRWGGSSGPTAKPAGRLKRAGRAAGGWVDRKTGQKASTAFKAARGQKGFRARSKAASRAVRKKGGGRITSGIVGVVVAAWAGLASLFGGSKKKTPTGKHAADTAAPSGTPEARYARDGYKLGPEVPGVPGSFYADPTDTRPGYADRRGLGPDHPGYTTGSYDANVDPRTWEERVAAGDAPGFSHKTSNSTHSGGTTMAGLPASQIAHDMSAAMSRYEPADAWTVVAEAKQWPDVSTQVAMSVKCYADRLESARFPLNPAIVGKLQEYFQALAASRSVAEELYPLLQKAHAEDIAKKEAPRGNESLWNV
ncbi:hypothetical protein Q7689_00545 [Nocardiopsis tropica]|uniref:hypothetical protein n=1 Tax=Nocardiopsis tropica TaxID=109330 RepID=UPI002E892ACC|nr:hypothetical protein [Nocardiopsis tropica]